MTPWALRLVWVVAAVAGGVALPWAAWPLWVPFVLGGSFVVETAASDLEDCAAGICGVMRTGGAS